MDVDRDRKIPEVGVQKGPDRLPGERTTATTQGGEGDRGDPQRLPVAPEPPQARLEVGKSRGESPGGLGGEIQDPVVGTAPEVEGADREAVGLAEISVLPKHLGVAVAGRLLGALVELPSTSIERLRPGCLSRSAIPKS
jgi:hypothetical protein